MKKILKLIVLVIFLHGTVFASLQLEVSQVKLINSLSRFIDHVPEGQGLKMLEKCLESDNTILKGFASLILYKHFSSKYEDIFLHKFTLNTSLNNFKHKEESLIKMTDLPILLKRLSKYTRRFSDDRVARLYLFYYFRYKNINVIGMSRERLSLAVFYRASTLDCFLTNVDDLFELANYLDNR